MFKGQFRLLQVIVDVFIVEDSVEIAFPDDYILVLVGMVLANLLGPECLIRYA